MTHTKLFLLFLLSIPATARAIPAGCSLLAAEGKDLWIVDAGKAPRHLLSGEQEIRAGTFSPTGQEVAFSAEPPSTSVATEVVFADASGRTLGRFRLDKPQGEGGLRYVEEIQWRAPRTLLTQGNQGPNGGYLDVWRLGGNYSGAKRIRRVLLMGGWCAISPSTQYVACSNSGAIMILNTSVPADEDGVVDDQNPFETPRFWGEDEFSEGLESNMVWDADGLTLHAVMSLNSKHLLTTLEKNLGAARDWKITDREISGVDPDSRLVSLEVDGNGALLGTQESYANCRKAYRVEGVTSVSSSDVIVHLTSPTELRPESLEIDSAHGKLTLKVLDVHCGSPTLPQRAPELRGERR